MAANTDKAYRNQVMYSVFVRNYSAEGTFEAVRRDLARIQGLGVDIIWFLPIHPIGQAGRKGTLGSPYAISDYRGVNPEFGTMEEFKTLVRDIHRRGMKCIIDVVYHHASPDSWLAQHYPQWFYHRLDGSFQNREQERTDVIDLDYSSPGLWNYQIETLKQWAAIVDGFYCDAAPLVPLEFWMEARRQVQQVRPDCIWVAETMKPQFIVESRAAGLNCHSDCEMYHAFDLTCDDDVYGDFRNYLDGKITLSRYCEALSAQESIYPGNYVKLRRLENDDRERITALIPRKKNLENWMAFVYFQKGMTLLQSGQEVGDSWQPSLFDRDTIRWSNGTDYSMFLRQLYWLKKDPLFTDSRYTLRALPRDVLLAVHEKDGHKLVGLFSLRGETAFADVDLPDGIYDNALGGAPVEITGGKLCTKGSPIVIRDSRG